MVKKFVDSDYKSGRVKDPTQIDEKKKKAIKDFSRQFMEKALAKQAEQEKSKKEKLEKAKSKENTSGEKMILEEGMNGVEHKDTGDPANHKNVDSDAEFAMNLTDEDKAAKESMTPVTPVLSSGEGLKRKRETDVDGSSAEDTPSKRARSITPDDVPPPPPPPPPRNETSPSTPMVSVETPNEDRLKRKWGGESEEASADEASPTKRSRSNTPPTRINTNVGRAIEQYSN